MFDLRIGNVTISSIMEHPGIVFVPQEFFLSYDKETGDRHRAALDPVMFDQDGNMMLTIQSFVVRTPKHTIMVDTCLGDHKDHPPFLDYPKQPWLDGFSRLGLKDTDIDYVFCTHLHVDHTGWNTKLVNGRWIPTFPNAKYIFHKKEYSAWEDGIKNGDERALHGENVYKMNCLPIVEAGQAIFVDDSFTIDDTVSLIPTPGHSPHHCCINIRSGGQRAVVTGDLFHHAFQCCEPGWSTGFDWDPKQAETSRRKFFADVADTGTLLLPIHFPPPTAGTISPNKDRRDSFVWLYKVK
jgi:glyoxylase-like metal-dependent hydrolase (beta-lactamase superfamily II)